MRIEEMLQIMKSIPLKHKGVVREHKLYKIYLPKEFDDLWRYLHDHGKRVDVVVLIPEIGRHDKPNILKLVDKIVMRNRCITKERDRFKIYLSSMYNDIWEYLNKHEVRVDVIVMLR